jgi:hypothetical protein
MNNMQRLGNVLASRMKTTSAAAVPMTIELGTINSNLSLTTDSLPTPIPKGDYMINIMLASDTYRTSSESHSHSGGSHSHSGGDHSHSGGSHSHSGGDHDHALPDVFRALKAGDRVLVAWCGNEPVVIAIVVSS